jgi:hypothetical protein
MENAATKFSAEKIITFAAIFSEEIQGRGEG